MATGHEHTVKAFDEDIKHLRALISQMGGLAEEAIGDAMLALCDFVTPNESEAEALTGIKDPLGAADKALDWADMVLCTAGPIGLYMASYTEEDYKRETTHTLLPGVIPEFNMYEFSRPMAREKCRNPARIYSHISPYMGGPEKIKNTNGAGDGALLEYQRVVGKTLCIGVPGRRRYQPLAAKTVSHRDARQKCRIVSFVYVLKYDRAVDVRERGWFDGTHRSVPRAGEVHRAFRGDVGRGRRPAWARDRQGQPALPLNTTVSAC